MITRAVSIVTYNRKPRLREAITGVLSTVPDGTDVYVCDDGSTDSTGDMVAKEFPTVHYYRGPNMGVGTNKTRALFLMQNHHFSCILEDDLIPQESGWFQIYETVATMTDIHHFCRVQDKLVPETHASFARYLHETMNVTPIYGPSPRGDMTFITKKVTAMVGGMNPLFKGCGYAHGEWSDRVARAGLIMHPNKWVDIHEAQKMFKQVGDTEGGRWLDDQDAIKVQLKLNQATRKALKKDDYTYCPLRLE